MVGWVRERTGFGEMDAYQFVSQHVRAPIVQVVDRDGKMVSAVKLQKRRLPSA